MSGLDRKLAPAQIWKHFKGGTYGIIAVGRYEPTSEPVVIYSQITAGEHSSHGGERFPEDTIWVRPLEEFLGYMKMDLAVINRFERIS